MSFEVVLTTRGVPAVRDVEAGEVMHPVVGPLVEASALYVEPSRLLQRLQAEPLVLFDVGLGAGANAAAAWRCSEARAVEGPRLEIVSFDRTLDALALAISSEHAEALGFDGPARAAAKVLLSAGVHETPRTRWRVVLGELPDALARCAAAADVVFWDPFSPRANPTLWDVRAFSALFDVCGPRATVHTYSAATATRSAMLLAGFAVGVGPDSANHGASTEGAMRPADLGCPLDARWLARLERSSVPFPHDAPAEALGLVRCRPQFSSSSEPKSGPIQ